MATEELHKQFQQTAKNTAKRQRMSTVYIVILTYIKPLEEIDAAIPAHVEWLKKGMQRGFSWHPEDGSQETVGSFSRNVRVLPLLKSAYARILFRG
jgi:hypothetical protein